MQYIRKKLARLFIEVSELLRRPETADLSVISPDANVAQGDGAVISDCIVEDATVTLGKGSFMGGCRIAAGAHVTVGDNVSLFGCYFGEKSMVHIGDGCRVSCATVGDKADVRIGRNSMACKVVLVGRISVGPGFQAYTSGIQVPVFSAGSSLMLFCADLRAESRETSITAGNACTVASPAARALRTPYLTGSQSDSALSAYDASTYVPSQDVAGNAVADIRWFKGTRYIVGDRVCIIGAFDIGVGSSPARIGSGCLLTGYADAPVSKPGQLVFRLLDLGSLTRVQAAPTPGWRRLGGTCPNTGISLKTGSNAFVVIPENDYFRRCRSNFDITVSKGGRIDV